MRAANSGSEFDPMGGGVLFMISTSKSFCGIGSLLLLRSSVV
jgi:hypothetical protein